MKVQFTRTGKAVTSSDTAVQELPKEVIAVPNQAVPEAVQKAVQAAVELVDTVEVDEEAALEAQMKELKAKKKALKEAAEEKAKVDADAELAARKTVVIVAPQPAVNTSVNSAEIAVINEPRSVALAAPSDVSNGIISGDFDETDIKPPRLQIVQGSGELSKKYSHGTVLLDDTVLFKAVDPSEPQPTFRFVPLGLIKAFRERLDMNDPDNKDVQPRIAHTKDEVLRLGGTTEWRNGEQPTWNPTATVMMLIEKPDNTNHAGFNMEAKGKLYCPAVFYASGTSYRQVATKIFNASQYQLVELDAIGQPVKVIYKKYWVATLAKVPAGSYTVFTLDVRLGEEITGPELRGLSQRFLGGLGNKKIEIAE